MFKKRVFSVYGNFKTCILNKLLLTIGIALVAIFTFIKIAGFFGEGTNDGFLFQMNELSNSTISESIIAFSVIFIGVGLILFFFNCQLAKLAKIADEIENDFKEE